MERRLSTYFYADANEYSLNVDKIDINTGKREPWQVIAPRDPVGLRPMTVPIAITPDGRYIAFIYRVTTGLLYRADSLK